MWSSRSTLDGHLLLGSTGPEFSQPWMPRLMSGPRAWPPVPVRNRLQGAVEATGDSPARTLVVSKDGDSGAWKSLHAFRGRFGNLGGGQQFCEEARKSS